MSINTNVIKAGTYSVEIVFTLDEDTRETELDRMFEDAMYMNFNDISASNIGEYFEIEED